MTATVFIGSDYRIRLTPQTADVQCHRVRRSVLALLVLSLVTFFLGLGRQAITDSDEAFYAEAAREMVEGNDWLTPHFNYEDRWQKPILYYWFTAAAFAGTDVTEFMARFGAALSGVGLVLLTWSITRRLLADAAAAWLAGAIVATCYGYFAMARAALPDLPLALFITATIWATLRATDPAERLPTPWAAIAGLSAGLGFLTKGPLGVVIPAIVLIPIWWRERTRVVVRPADTTMAFVLFAISGLPWYVVMWAVHGTPYLQSFFVADNLERFATTRFNDVRAVWYYVPILVGGLIPWTIFGLVLPWALRRESSGGMALAFAILGLAVASAENYRVTLSQPSTVKGTKLKAGEYRLNVENSKLTIVKGRESVEVPVTVQNVDTKFDNTAIRYTGSGDKVSITEIRLGGTKTKLVFEEQSGL